MGLGRVTQQLRTLLCNGIRGRSCSNLVPISEACAKASWIVACLTTMAHPLGLVMLIQAFLAISLLAPGIHILVEAQLPGSSSVINFRVYSPYFLPYRCDGTLVRAGSQPEVIRTPNTVTDARIGFGLCAVPPLGCAVGAGSVPVLAVPAGSLDSVAQEVYQVKNAGSGLCWTSGGEGSYLNQVACASDASTIASAATRRQLFTLALVQSVATCDGPDGVYEIRSIYDNGTYAGNVNGRLGTLTGPLRLTPDRLFPNARWLTPNAASQVFITTRIISQ